MTTAHVRGVELDYDRSPAGGADHATMIWGHGLTSSRAAENELGVIDWSAFAGVPMVRYDARGHGVSGSTEAAEGYHWRELALDQLELADQLGIDRYVAGGASMGTGTALHAAVVAPERILGLVLAIPPTAWDTRAAQQDTYEVGAQLIEAGRTDVLIKGTRATPPPDPMAASAVWGDRFEKMVTSTDPARLARIFRGAALADLPAPGDITRISVPTLILAWTGDPGHPMSTAQRLAELIPDARLVTASTPGELEAWTPTAHDFVASVTTGV